MSEYILKSEIMDRINKSIEAYREQDPEAPEADSLLDLLDFLTGYCAEPFKIKSYVPTDRMIKVD